MPPSGQPPTKRHGRNSRCILFDVLYPFTFEPRFKERIWGGRRLAEMYAKALPPDAVIGESWEISDRPGDESVIANGPLAGRTIRWLMEQHGRDVLGVAQPAADGRFPLLCKILDARATLSLQVHPPATKAEALGGDASLPALHEGFEKRGGGAVLRVAIVPGGEGVAQHALYAAME